MSGSVRPQDVGDWLRGHPVAGDDRAAVLAGHFAIFTAGGRATDALDQGNTAAPAMREMIAFTRASWQAACSAIVRGARFRLVPLVDDIQFVRPQVTQRTAAERLAAALAGEYLDRTGTLPGYHRGVMTAAGIDDARVLRASESRWLFSERDLRIAATRRVRAAVGSGGLDRLHPASSDNGGTITVQLPDHGSYCVVQSGHTGCAGGYAELLARLDGAGITRLVALIPLRCLGSVSLGTVLARRLFGARRLAVTTVAIAEDATIDAAIIEEPT